MDSPDRSRIAVAASAPCLLDCAGKLAKRLGLALVSIDEGRCAYLLVLTPKRLELRSSAARAAGPVYVDFSAGRDAYRRRFGGGRRQALARACGLRAGWNPEVLDATAGLGRDAFVLASLGCRVQAVERSPWVAALLADGLRRAAKDAELRGWLDERLQLTVADARDVMGAAIRAVDVVYLDPMYPQRDQSALVKKELRVLRALVGSDGDAAQLLGRALRYARARVVVKRPRPAPPLDDFEPSFSKISTSTRFDVYLV